MRRFLLPLAVAIALAVAGLVAVGGTLSGPVRWTPDGLFYQARSLELRGVERDVALERAFQGPSGDELRRIDPERSGDPAWVRANAPFYERRVTVPLAGAALNNVSGERAILDVSLAGYIAAILAIFGLLLLRFRLAVAALVALATAFLPALVEHASYPLTDSWGLALETAALAAGMLVLERGGRRWLLAWFAAILVLSFTRDSAWILVGAALWLCLRVRSRVSWRMLAAAIAAALPALLIFSVPTRELLATMLNDARPAPDASWGFVLERYPGAVWELLRADGGFVRDGAWLSALYLAGGLLALFVLTRGAPRGGAATLLKAGAVVGVLYVLAVPVFSAFRLDLVCVPMAAWGLALAVEWLAQRVPAWRRRARATAGARAPSATGPVKV